MDILIVDDDRVSAFRLRTHLKELGHEVTTARDGEAAWRLISELNPGLIISDWMMPKLDGPELCRRIRAQTRGPYRYVILLTSLDGVDDRIAGLEAGADDFLVKPFDPLELQARLKVAERILAMEAQLRSQADRLREMHDALRRQNERLAELAVTDALTGLGNHRRLREALISASAMAARQTLPLSLVMLDVDHFKRYNDTYGHPAGDEVLRTIGSLLLGCARPYDVIARYGGEEFAALLPGAEADDALHFAERLRLAISGHDWIGCPVTASLGVATSSGDLGDGSSLIELADRALYHSKHLGRDRVTHARDLPEIDPASEDSLGTTSGLAIGTESEGRRPFPVPSSL